MISPLFYISPRSNHPGQNNTPENGVYYNKTNGAYECPGIFSDKQINLLLKVFV